MQIKLIAILIILVFISGCAGPNTPNNIFIEDWSTEPANVKSDETFALHTTISNPTQFDDEGYIEYKFDKSLLTKYNGNQRLTVGTISAGEMKKVHNDFTPRSGSAGKNCDVLISLYTTLDSEVPISQIVVNIQISEELS